MRIHLVDGTYELFRSFYGAPPKKAPDGREVGATLGLLNSLLSLLTKSSATHVACAFDQVIESFRNDLFPGYKTSQGVAPDLLAQFPLAEEAVAALGLVVWPMVEFEADDALASAATRFRDEPGVDQVVVCSPDKDLAQFVSGNQVVCWDRRRDIVYDEAAVLAKFGVRPSSIPDWLALVGDSADGYPGLLGWGQSLQARCSPVTNTSSRFPETMADGAWEWPARSGLPKVSGFIRRKFFCIGAWRLFDETFRSKKESLT
jgi:5'-3' exonuclease